jgi:hypothetical protein
MNGHNSTTNTRMWAKKQTVTCMSYPMTCVSLMIDNIRESSHRQRKITFDMTRPQQGERIKPDHRLKTRTKPKTCKLHFSPTTANNIFHLL